MSHLVILSALYLIVASISPVMGGYVLRLNPKEGVNRAFFAISMCLMLWALGFSVVIVAPNEAAAVFWMRVAAVGFELLYSILLHFTLLLTGCKKLLSKWWLYLLMYLPALVCLYAFSVSPGLTGAIYQFENTQRGWVRVTGATAFDTVFQLYYISAVLLSLALLWRWKRKAQDAEVKKQANHLIAAFAVSIGLGTFTDVINGMYLSLPIPQMAPVFFLIPLWAIFYNVSRYRFMKPSVLHEMELILNDERRTLVFKVASTGLIVGGVVLFFLEHFWWEAQNPALTVLASALLVGSGGILIFAQRAKRGYWYLELLLILATITLTPVLTINMLPYGGQTIWAFPILLIISALSFNSSNMLLAASVSTFLSQVYLLAVAPPMSVPFDYRTYTGRLIVLACIITISYFVHRIYILRLKDNAAQTKTQSLMSDIVSRFSLEDHEDAPERMRTFLMELTEFFNANTALICAVETEFSEAIGLHYYCTDGSEISPEHKMLCMERWETFRRETLEDSQTPYNQRSAMAEQLQQWRAAPWIFVPIFEKENPVAFLYVESSRTNDAWTKEQLIALPVLSRIVSDALEKLSAEMRIKFMAYYDSLTKLPNRSLFFDRAEQAIHMARRSHHTLGFLFLDLDFFKSINDTMGHDGGDQMLQIIGQNLSDCVRKTDTVARFGGDEFLILLNSVADVDDIAMVADKIMEVFKAPFSMRGQEVFVTASVGIAVYPVDGEDAQTLIKHADVAMYTAKEKGKNQYAFCSSNMKEKVQYRVSIANSLHKALGRKELKVFYQPQIDLRTEKIVGLEALLRWDHPEYGMLSPAEFIPLAEQTGLINPIGAWVLETACVQTARWTQMGFGNLRVSVNLSVVQLRNPGLAGQVAQILARTGINPAQVELEIAEGAMMREPDYIIRVLNDLKALGISLSIDDFGIEYASLNRLKRLPVDRLKMDTQFVRGIDKSPKEQAATMVIINLAKNMDVKLVAEGVESDTQRDFLKNRMCDEVQGYYYYRPMPAEDIERVLNK